MNNYLVIDRMSNVFSRIFPLDKRPCFDMKMKIDAAYGVDVSKKEKLAVFAARSDDSREKCVMLTPKTKEEEKPWQV